MAHAHESAASGRKARVSIVTVSTSRSPAEDASGALLADLATAAGHTIVRRELVPDDPSAIGALLDLCVAATEVDVVLLTGGTGVSARDCTPAVVRERLTRHLPGFGELFRALSYQEVGSAAMLSDAVGGLSGATIVFALPGSTKACRLAMEKLILPELGHLLAELAKESLLPSASPRLIHGAGGLRPPGAIQAVVRPGGRGGAAPARTEDASDRPRAYPPTMTIVEVVLETLEGQLDPSGAVSVPAALEACPAAMDVLNSAGQRLAVRFADGELGVAFGFPDLQRRNAKVLVVRPGEPIARIVAAHRGVNGVGLCADGSDSRVIPSADERLAKVTQARTKVAYEGEGRLFAVDYEAVYFLDDGRVHRWDGRARTLVGTPAQAVGSLLLSWSQR